MVKIDHVFKSSIYASVQFSSFQSLSRVRLFVTPWIAAGQASLSITNSRSLLKLISYYTIFNISASLNWPRIRENTKLFLIKLIFSFFKKGLFLEEEKNPTHLIKCMFFDEDQTFKFPHLLSCNIKMKLLYHFSFFFWTFNIPILFTEQR